MSIDEKLKTLAEEYSQTLSSLVEDKDLEKELEDELAKVKDQDVKVDPVDYNDDEETDLDLDGDDDVDADDISKLLDEDTFEDEEMNEKFKNKHEILKGRYKKKAQKMMLDKMAGGKKITPVMLAQFKTNYEFDSKLGRFGKWVIRKNKSDFKKKNPVKNLVKNIKKKAKRMKKLLKKGSVKSKIERGKKRAQIKTGGKNISAKGVIS